MCYNTTTGDGKYRAANRLVLQEYIKTMFFFQLNLFVFLKSSGFAKKLIFVWRFLGFILTTAD
jgi:hypothetical protein